MVMRAKCRYSAPAIYVAEIDCEAGFVLSIDNGFEQPEYGGEIYL